MADPINVEPASNVGKPFNYDAASFLSNRRTPDAVSFDPIGEDDLVRTTRDRINSLLQGELPEEVLQQVERRAAEKGFTAGLTGEAARNLTFRDLGASAMDAITTGLEASNRYEALRLQREQANRSLEVDAAKLNEEIRQADDRFAISMRDADRQDAQLAMEGLRLQALNLQFRIQEENRLIIANSQKKINNLQQNMDTMAGAFDSLNTGYQKFIELSL
jgi:hypothetical protein